MRGNVHVLEGDFIENLIQRIAWKQFESEKAKKRNNALIFQKDKVKRIVVLCQDELVYDSDENATIPDPLSASLVAYANPFDEVLKDASKKKRAFKKLQYDIRPSVTSIFPSQSLENLCTQGQL